MRLGRRITRPVRVAMKDFGKIYVMLWYKMLRKFIKGCIFNRLRLPLPFLCAILDSTLEPRWLHSHVSLSSKQLDRLNTVKMNSLIFVVYIQQTVKR